MSVFIEYSTMTTNIKQSQITSFESKDPFSLWWFIQNLEKYRLALNIMCWNGCQTPSEGESPKV